MSNTSLSDLNALNNDIAATHEEAMKFRDKVKPENENTLKYVFDQLALAQASLNKALKLRKQLELEAKAKAEAADD